MSSVIADLRYAARELRRRPGFALTAILSLALGIGATSAVFSVVYGVLINPFPYVGADRMMQLALRDSAGRFRYPGMSGAQLEQLRQARTVESVVGEDGWNLTTTDGDIPEDVVASYISPERAESLGRSSAHGAMAHPRRRASGSGPGARRRARLSVLAALLLGRSGRGRPHDPARSQGLSNRRRDAAAVPLARSGHLPAAQGQARAQHLLRRRASRSGRAYRRREANAELQPILQEFAKQTPGRYPDTFRVNLRSIIEMYARPMGPTALPAARRGDVAAARRLRQRVDPAARARRAPPAGARRARGARRRTCPHRAAAVDRGAGRSPWSARRWVC